MPATPRAYLLTSPETDLRPDTFDDGVLNRVITPRLAPFMAWLQYRVPHLTEELAMEVARHAIRDGRGDGFAAALLCKNDLNWPVDSALCIIYHEMCAAISVALRHEQRDWAVRTGMRFPGSKGDLIEWYDETNRRFTGKIEEIDSTAASAYVMTTVGQMNTGSRRRVYAETVTQNRSRIIHRQVGFTVEPAEPVAAND